MFTSTAPKSVKSVRAAMTVAVVSFTVGIVQLWALTTHAADTRTTVTKNADGSQTTCTYKKDFVQVDGANMIRNAFRCVTVKASK